MAFGFSREDHSRVSRATKVVEAIPASAIPEHLRAQIYGNGIPVQLGVLNEDLEAELDATATVNIWAKAPPDAPEEVTPASVRTVYNWTGAKISAGRRVEVFAANARLYARPSTSAVVAAQVWTNTQSIALPSGANEFVDVTGYQHEIDSGLEADPAAGTITFIEPGVYYAWAHLLVDLGASGRSCAVRFEIGGTPGTLEMGAENSNQTTFAHVSLSGLLVKTSAADNPETVKLQIANSAAGTMTITDIVFGAYAVVTGEGTGGGGTPGDGITPSLPLSGTIAGNMGPNANNEVLLSVPDPAYESTSRLCYLDTATNEIVVNGAQGHKFDVSVSAYWGIGNQQFNNVQIARFIVNTPGSVGHQNSAGWITFPGSLQNSGSSAMTVHHQTQMRPAGIARTKINLTYSLLPEPLANITLSSLRAVVTPIPLA